MSILTLGIDIGSTACKCVVLEDGTRICSRAVVPLGTGTKGSAQVYEQALEEAGLTEQDLACFAWKDDAYLVHFAVSKMIVELHGLFAELLQEDKGMNDAQTLGGTILTFCARWSLILSGDETPLPDFADNTEVKFDE